MDKEKKTKYRVIAGIVLAVVTLLVYGAGQWFDREEGIRISQIAEEGAGQAGNAAEESEGDSNIHNIIIVDICGAVNAPGVYELAEGSRLYEAIELAGGLTEDACVRLVNRAALLTDGEKVYIYTETEATAEETAGASASGGAGGGGKVNINTANSETLQNLKGVGPATAAKIIEYRDSYGPFKAIEDIMNVSGIGEKTFAGFRESIRVN